MTEQSQQLEAITQKEYKAGFVTDIEVDSLPPGLNEDVIRQISFIKNEPEWMLEQEVLVTRAALRGTEGGPRACPNCRSLVAPELLGCPECGASMESRV
mgnify:CR=1 FL=1